MPKPTSQLTTRSSSAAVRSPSLVIRTTPTQPAKDSSPRSAALIIVALSSSAGTATSVQSSSVDWRMSAGAYQPAALPAT